MADLNAKPNHTNHMSNSEYIEELMHKAYEKGFFEKMHGKVNEIKSENVDIPQADAYYKAYQELKVENKATKKANYDHVDHGDVYFVDGVDIRPSKKSDSNYDDSDSYAY